MRTSDKICYLLINCHSIKPIVHDVYPAILAGQNKQAHQSLAKVVKIIFSISPSVFWKFQTVKLCCYVLSHDVRSLTVVKHSFEKLKTNFDNFLLIDVLTWTPRIPKIRKNVQQMRTMFPIGFKEISKD